MKRMLMLVLALAMILCLCACGGDHVEETVAPPAEEVVETPTEEVTEAPTEAEPAGIVYTVNVVDEGGNPIADAMVQLCAEACYPNKTNELGVATFSLEEAEYKVSFLKMPEGYEAIDGATEYYFDAGSTEITITLKAVA